MHEQFASRLDSTRNKVSDIVKRYESGSIDADHFGDELYHELVAAHTDAYKIGMLHGGTDMEPLALQTISHQHGRQVADGENHWLDKFVSDLDADRYTDDDGTLQLGAINQRAQMYAAKTRATANQGFVDASAANDPEEQFAWELASEKPCKDCPRLAALSPYSSHELFTVPGAGDTECLVNCACRIVRLSDGRAGFTI